MKLHTKYQRPRPSSFREDFSSFFSQYIVFLCETCGLWRGAIFDPRAIVWIILVDVHKIKQHSKYQRPGSSSFREEDFLNFCIGIYVKKWPFCKKKLGHPKVIFFFSNSVWPMSQMLHTKPQDHWSYGSREEEFRVIFYHIWAWQPSGSCDADAANKLPFLLSIENPYEIWLWFLKRRMKSFTYILVSLCAGPF